MAKKGDLIHVNAQRVGGPPREGVIIEVMAGDLRVQYRVRWSDGRESLFAPGAGTVRIEPAPAHKRISSEGTKAGRSAAKRVTVPRPVPSRSTHASSKTTMTKTSTAGRAKKTTVRRVATKKAASGGRTGKRRTR